MGKKKNESNSSPESSHDSELPASTSLFDLSYNIINDRKEEIRTYRTIIASTIIAAIAIPLGIISVGKPNALKKCLWFIPKPGLWVLLLWLIGFGLLFFGVVSFFFVGKFSKEDEINRRLQRAVNELEVGNTANASRELRKGFEDSSIIMKKGRKALMWTLFAIIPFILTVIFVYLTLVFGGQ